MTVTMVTYRHGSQPGDFRALIGRPAVGAIYRTADTVRPAVFAGRHVQVLWVRDGEAWCAVRVGRRLRHAAFATRELLAS